jgi:serine/threonine protein kinase/Ca2+-binding EF-hand superfamily protein
VKRETVAATFDLNRDSETPVFTGRRPQEDSSGDSSDSEGQSDGSSSEDEIDKAVEKEVEEEMRQEAREFLEEELQHPAAKQQFIRWLFKLADTNHDDSVSVKELAPLIKALRVDGIIPESLCFAPERCKSFSVGSPDERLAREIIQEYDEHSAGVLTLHEFEALGELILRSYQLCSQYDPDENTVGNYLLKRRLGKGANGEVRLAVSKTEGMKKAIKIVPKGDVADCSKLDTEIKAMLMLQHPHIVRLEEVLESSEHVFFVMELCGGGNLCEYLDNEPISEDLARYYFSQIIDAVRYCHNQGVAHRDLSVSNLLLDNDANIKISDFGCAGVFSRGWDVFATPMVGGLSHLAPEQICGTAYSGEKIDIWSIGIILYTLLVGRIPFKATAPQQYLDDIRNVRYNVPNSVSSEACDLLTRLLVFDPAKRYSCDQIDMHPWMQVPITSAPILNNFNLVVNNEKLFGGHIRMRKKLKVIAAILKPLGAYVVPVADDEECVTTKLIYPEKDLKVSCSLRKGRRETQSIVEFELHEGESREFLSLMPKFKNIIQKAERKQSVQISPPKSAKSSPPRSPEDSDTSSSSSSSSSDSPSRHRSRRRRARSVSSSSSSSSSSTSSDSSLETDGDSRRSSRRSSRHSSRSRASTASKERTPLRKERGRSKDASADKEKKDAKDRHRSRSKKRSPSQDRNQIKSPSVNSGDKRAIILQKKEKSREKSKLRDEKRQRGQETFLS